MGGVESSIYWIIWSKAADRGREELELDARVRRQRRPSVVDSGACVPAEGIRMMTNPTRPIGYTPLQVYEMAV